MERRHLRSQQQQNVPPRESVVSWITETTRASMEFHYPEQSADSSSTQFDSQNTEDDNPPAYIPGQIITTCRPFVHIVTEEMKGRICDLCLRAPSSSSSNSSTSSKANQNNSKLRCCSDCQAMYFCGSCLASTTPSVFKALHALECPIYASYNAALSNPSKFFLRLYLRLENSESIPHTQQTVYFNPLTREELDFETLVPRLIYTSREEMTEHIQDFCERNSLKVYGGSEQAVSANSPVGSISSSSSSSKGAKNRRNKRQNNRGEVGQQQPPPNRTYKSVADFHLQGDTSSVEEIAVYQFMNLLEEFSRVEPLLPFIADDHQIYRLWNVFVRLWSYATPIVDEAVSGILSDGSSSAIAYGLYLEPNSVLFGHSCVPNTAFAFYGPVLQLRAMKAIFPGDSLSVNLVQLAVPQAERLRQLRSYFISTCFCPRCRGKSEAEVEEEEEGGGRDGDGQLSACDYERFRALKEEFGALFEAAFVTTPTETSTKTPLSLSAILHFTSGGGGGGDGGGGVDFDEQTIAESSAQCEKLHHLLERLLPLLGKIYPYEHPEKTRLAYAHTVVEMNRLLFKLDGRAAATAAVVSGEEGEKEGGGAGVQSSMVVLEERKGSKRFSNAAAAAVSSQSSSQSTTPTSSRSRRNLARMSDFSASVSPRAGNLDALTEEITAWSALLKSTVKAIRGTHGLDHRLYREVPVPLAPVWSRALALGGGGSTCSSGCSAALSIGELHRDPAVLLRILIHSGGGGGGGGLDQRPRSDRHSKPHGFSIGAHIESISRAFSQLFAEAYEGGGGGGKSDGRRQLTASTNSSSILSDVADDGTDDDDHTWQTFCRTLLIILALLFPFLIYYVVYVEDNEL